MFLTIPTFLSFFFVYRTTKSLASELEQTPSFFVIPTFSFEDLNKILAGPTIKTLNRYDCQSIVLFLLVKRTALDSAWLEGLPELRKMSIIFQVLFCSLSFFFFLFHVHKV